MTFHDAPAILGRASVVGPKEAEGPLGAHFDVRLEDDLMGLPSWEMAESEMLKMAAELCVSRAGLLPETAGALLAGDLLDQVMASGFAARCLDMPYVGLYGACSTFAEALAVGGALVDGGYLPGAVCAASSHFCTAERQFRFPLEMGTQRPPSAHWTATAAGAVALGAREGKDATRVTCATLGRVIDYRVTDANHMGAAMAPAVFDTIRAHFEDTGRSFADYDLVATGDLGWIGREILIELLEKSGARVDEGKLIDCGASLYAREQDPHAGGSGCGCVASVTCGWLLGRVDSGELKRMLVIGCGALLSPTTSQQGESIPSVAHAACLERGV